ncbi:MAG: FAD-dependent oxidoreductase [Alphaproteobacteria bacterium]|nr:FAD-dependent oxidoreductase [Alphaproteobacteria bacterium]
MRECPIAVIGAGPAGASAALHLADAGADVLLIDDKAEAGGAAFPPPSDEEPAFLWPDRAYRGEALRQALRDRAGRITCWQRRRVEAIRADHGLSVRDMETGGCVELHADAVIVATGAETISPHVPGASLPGVMSLGDPNALVAAARERPGARIVLAGGGPLLWFTAARCAAARLALAGVIDAAALPHPRHLLRFLRQPGLLSQGLGWMRAVWSSDAQICRRHAVTAILGEGRVQAVAFAPVGNGTPQRHAAADLVAIGHGLRPAVALLRAAGASVDRDAPRGLWLLRRDADLQTSLPGIFAAGDAGAPDGADAALAEGAIVAEAVLRRSGRKVGAALAVAADAARRRRRSLAAFAAALDNWTGPRPGLPGGDQRET